MFSSFAILMIISSMIICTETIIVISPISSLVLMQVIRHLHSSFLLSIPKLPPTDPIGLHIWAITNLSSNTMRLPFIIDLSLVNRIPVYSILQMETFGIECQSVINLVLIDVYGLCIVRIRKSSFSLDRISIQEFYQELVVCFFVIFFPSTYFTT